MTCNKTDISQLLPDLLAGKLWEEEAGKLREHLETCSCCAGEFRVLGNLAALEVPEPEAGFFDEMPGKVMRGIREEKTVSRTLFKLPAIDLKWKVGLAAVSLAAAALLVFLLPKTEPVLVQNPDDNIPPISVAMGFEANILAEGNYRVSDVSDALELDVELTEDDLRKITGAFLIGGVEYMDMDAGALSLFEEELGSIPQRS
jgi:hypothetical protein